MPKDDDEGQGLAPGFWTTQRIILAVVFVAGLILGVLATNQFLDPVVFQKAAPDYNALQETNQRLDTRNDQLYNCLLTNNVNPASCA